LTHVVTIAGGSYHSLVVKADGTAWSWGWNPFGQLGNGTTTTTGCECLATPVLVSNLQYVLAVAAGGGDSMALTSDGRVWTWGINAYGELGNGTVGVISTVPMLVSHLTGVVAIAAASAHDLALRSNGTVWAWGYNYDGELGNGTTTTTGCLCIPTPMQVKGLKGAAIAGGGGHSLAIG
jgi:alpha-tubulin suppressor-like RCC1 family protein